MSDPADPASRDRLAFHRLLTGALVILAAISMLRQLPGPDKPVPKDFGQYYVAGKLALRGQLDALYFVDLERGLVEKDFPDSRFMKTAREFGIPETSYFIYPPWVGLLYAPLALLPPYQAYALACLLCALSLLAAFVVLARALPGAGTEAALATFAVSCLAPTTNEAMLSAQASIPLFLILTLFASALWRGHPVRAGLWWALMTGLKLFPLMFGIYLLARREYRALVAGIAFGALLAGVSLLAGGWETNLRFVQLIRDHAPFSTTFHSNQSITGFALRLTGAASPLGWTILQVPPAVAWGARLAALATLALTLWLILRGGSKSDPKSDPWNGPLTLALFSIWAYQIAPHAWLHHLVALGLPSTVAAAHLLTFERHRMRNLALWLGAWALVNAHYLYLRLADESWTRPPLVLLASLPFFGAILLYVLLALELRGHHGPTR